MAAGRKLQAEIEKVLKKVEEGIEEFNNVWDNVHSAVHANQREKFEAELKTQIKKLQRDREQIKIWHSDKSIKDKVALAEARKKIEVEMERFKEFERDSKTKQYSKEGLSKSDKVDPHEEERSRHRNWIQENIDKLHVQIDEIDADAEAALSTKKSKGAKQDEAGLQHLRHIQDTHRWHATKLEQLLRKLDNDDVALAELDDLRDSVEYYADENSRAQGEFQPFDTIYEAFCLEDVEDYLTKDRDKGLVDKDDDKDDESKSVGTAAASEGSKSESRREEEMPKAPSKHTGGTAVAKASKPARNNQRSKEDGESSSQPQKAWPPMVSVWQNPPTAAAEREKVPPPAPSPAKPGPPAPTLPPPMQPAPDRPPPPGQAPVLNAPPNQPPPKPAPHAAPLPATAPREAPREAPHQLPQMQPPTQAPPQPPLPSPPVGSPPRPQAPPGQAVPSLPTAAAPPAPVAVAANPNGSMPGMGSAAMPAPPPMPPPAPQDGPSPATVVAGSPTPCPAGPGLGAAQAGTPAMSEPPTTAPPPPPPPVLPPPPPSPAPAPTGPPSTTPVLPTGHAKAPPPGVVESEPAWPPAVPCLPDEHLQQAPKVPPPIEAPPPPSESPPPPPPEAPGPTPAVAEVPSVATTMAPLETRAYPAPASTSPAAYEPGSGLPPPPPAPGPGMAVRSVAAAATRPVEPPGPLAMPEARNQLSPRKLESLDLLAASHRHLPAPSDGRRNRKYAPRNPYVHTDQNGSAAYPLQPTTGYEDPGMFKKYDLDTLFFIFYYQQGSYQQHLAAKELKKLSWRYHTKYLTWFQRHEEPRMAASDFERGAYVYFDHETGWCQRIKADFTFEYQFLEDEPVSG